MKKNWKKSVLVMLLALMLALAGCGKEAAEPAQTEAEPAETVTDVEEPAEAAPAEAEPVAEEPAAEPESKPEAPAAASGAVSAVTNVDQSELLDIYKLELLETTNVLSMREDYGSYYKLVDADLNVLADEDFIYLDGNEGFVSFAVEDVTNCMGLMDTAGNVVMPASYGEIDVLSERWTAGIVLADATEANYDYYSFGGGYYLVDTVDIFYCGEKVGTLGRDGYKRAYGFGDFIYVYDLEGNYHYYDKAFTEAEPKSEYGTDEFDYDYSTDTIWHLGSGTAAFTEGCTLTPDQVACSVYEKDGSLYDLQGNVIGSTAAYSSVYSFEDGYAKITDRTGKYGILREDGTVISECVYESIDLYDNYVVSGYVPGELDGKFCIISLADGSVFTSDYAKSAMDEAYAPFASKVTDDGKVCVLTPTGMLEETFDEVDISYDAQPVITVCIDGAYGIIDLTGAHIVEPDSMYDYSWRLSVSSDGSLILAEAGDGYYIYKLTY